MTRLKVIADSHYGEWRDRLKLPTTEKPQAVSANDDKDLLGPERAGQSPKFGTRTIHFQLAVACFIEELDTMAQKLLKHSGGSLVGKLEESIRRAGPGPDKAEIPTWKSDRTRRIERAEVIE